MRTACRRVVLCVIFLLFPALNGRGEDAMPVTFLERFNAAIDEAAAKLLSDLATREPGAFEGGDAPVRLGVFPVIFSDGGIVELGRLAHDRMIFAVKADPHVSVMGEQAFASAPYVLKGTLSPPIQGLVECNWKLESRTGDINFDFQTVASASSRIRLPSDPVSRKNLLLYIKQPAGKADLASVEVPLLKVEMRIEATRKTNSGHEETTLANGDWLGSGDQFRICLIPNTDCHAYIFIRDSAQELYSLFPSPGIELPNRLEGGMAHWIPEADRQIGTRWFYLDDNPGLETLYLVADYEPIGNVETLLRSVSARQSDAEVTEALRHWAVENGGKENLRFRVFDGEGLRELEERFSLVQKFTIEHR